MRPANRGLSMDFRFFNWPESLIIMSTCLVILARLRRYFIDLFDFLIASVFLHVSDDGLRGEHRGAKQMYFRLRARPFVALQALHSEFDHEPVRQDTPFVSLIFDAFPLLGGETDVLLCCLSHSFCRSFLKDFPRFRFKTIGKLCFLSPNTLVANRESSETMSKSDNTKPVFIIAQRIPDVYAHSIH